MPEVIYRSEGFELDPARGELRKGGEPLALQLKPFAVLLHLVRHRERFVSKRELLDTLWPDAVVSETALTTAVKAIRRALGDGGGAQTFIETRRGRGYRFVAPVRADAARPQAPDDFVGRDAALASLDAALERALAGEGCVVLVRGEAGIGKTRVMAEFTRSLQAREIPTLTAWCSEDRAGPPYWPWAQWMRGLQGAGLLPDEASALEEIAPLRSETVKEVDPETDTDSPLAERKRFLLFDCASRLLRNAARDRGLVLFLDDAHAADDASLRLLAYVARELPESRLTLVAALREPAARASRVLTEVEGQVARLPHGRQLELGGLAEEEAARLVRTLRGSEVAEGAVHRIVERAGGNPFYLREFARAEGPELPAAVRDALRARIGRLPPACTETLVAAAVAGRGFSVELVAHALGRPAAEVVDALGAAEADGLIHQSPAGYRFDHGIVRETILAAQGRGRLAELHLRVGEALEQEPGDVEPGRLARHFVEASHSAGARAVEYSRRAGDGAWQVFAWEDAALHFERALAALEFDPHPDLAARGELLVRLAIARHRAGASLPEIEEALGQAVAIARQRGDGTALARAAVGVGVPVRSVDLGELAEEALRLRSEPNDVLTVGLWSRLAVERLRDGRLQQAQAAVAKAMSIAEALGDPDSVSFALMAKLFVMELREGPRERLAVARRAIAEAERAGAPERASIARWKIFYARLELGDPEAPLEHEAFGRFIEERRYPRARVTLHRQRATLDFLGGDLEGCERALDEAFELARRENNAITLALVQGSRFFCLRERGDGDAMHAWAQTVPDVPGFRTVRRCALADAHALRGEADAAREALDALLRDITRPSPFLSERLVACWLAEACAGVGDPAHASAFLTWLEPHLELHAVGFHGAACLGSTFRYAGILASALGFAERADDHFRDALAANERAGAPLFSAHVRCDYARLLLVRGAPGDRDRALTLLDEAEAWVRSRPLPALHAALRGVRLEPDGVVPIRGRPRA